MTLGQRALVRLICALTLCGKPHLLSIADPLRCIATKAKNNPLVDPQGGPDVR